MKMPRPIPAPLLSSANDFVADRLGIHFPETRLGDLERGLTHAACELGDRDAETLALRLLSMPLTRKELDALAIHLTVGETYFFREKETLRLFSETILPAALEASRKAGRPLRIWSAGCCTGEEPYTIAMLLDAYFRDAGASPVMILGTDINPRFLRKALDAVYGEWSFRDTPDAMRQRYFRKIADGRWELDPRIRTMVRFSPLNLAGDDYPSILNDTNALDVIFCRNVLMYFSLRSLERVVSSFLRALVPGGCLVVSPAEASSVTFAAFRSVQLPGGTLYQKAAPGRPAARFVPPMSEERNGGETLPLAAGSWSLELASPDRHETAPQQETSAAGPATPDELVAGARRCANEGRLAEAAALCERAIAAEKINPAYHYLLSAIQRESGQIDAALQSLSRTLFLDQGFVLAHFGMANLELQRGRGQEAARHLANALIAAEDYAAEAPLPESDGLTAGRFREVVTSLLAALPPQRVAAARRAR